jgi:hypothetical protein
MVTLLPARRRDDAHAKNQRKSAQTGDSLRIFGRHEFALEPIDELLKPRLRLYASKCGRGAERHGISADYIRLELGFRAFGTVNRRDTASRSASATRSTRDSRTSTSG